MEFLLKNQSELNLVAKELLRIIDPSVSKNSAFVALFNGDLGAGKTSLTKELGLLLGIKESIVSPTFAIFKAYNIDYLGYKFLYHIDLYRIEKEDDIKKLGIDEIVRGRSNIVIVEWGSKFSSLFPKENISVNFEHVNNGERKVIIKNDKNK